MGMILLLEMPICHYHPFPGSAKEAFYLYSGGKYGDLLHLHSTFSICPFSVSYSKSCLLNIMLSDSP